jgi:hypothetical protein
MSMRIQSRRTATVVVLLLTACSSHAFKATPPASPVTERPGLGLQSLAQQIIRRGRVDVTVPRITIAQQRFESAAGALGAQVSRLDAREQERAEYYVRVAPERLDALMDSAAVLGDVASRAVSAQDVAEQVVDVEARLGVMRASRDRLKQLMDRGASVADVIAVERELARVQSEIESLEARLAVLNASVARSDLTVSMEQRRVLGPLGVVAVGIGKVFGKLFVWR